MSQCCPPLFGQPDKPITVEIGPGAVNPDGLPADNRGKYTVSSSSRVMRGEFVRLQREYLQSGAEMRWGNEDVSVLAVEPLHLGRVGVVYTQSGVTKFKVLALDNNAMALGNALEIVDEAVPAAALVSLTKELCAVLYNPDASGAYSTDNDNQGQMVLVKLDGRTASVDSSACWTKPAFGHHLIWSNGSPYNICACRMADDELLICATLKAPGKIGQAYAGRLRRNKDGTWGAIETIPLDLPHDQDEYATAWSAALVSDGVAVVSCWASYDQPISWAVLDTDAGHLQVRCTGGGKYASSMPCTSIAQLGNGRFALAYGVAWMSEDGRLIKSTVAMEEWGLTRYAAELLWYGCERARYHSAVGAIYAAPIDGACAVSYVADSVGQSLILDLAGSPSPGPTIGRGAVGSYYRLIPIGSRRALEVVVRGGCGYVRQLDCVERASPATDRVDGVAISGGEPGDPVVIARPSMSNLDIEG